METSSRLDRALGVVPTPIDLVKFMVALAAPPKKHCFVLEPACGDCPFLEAFAECYGFQHEFVGIDIDPKAIIRSKVRLPFATVLEGDFLLWQPNERFDIIIGNPPYGIIGDASHYPIHILKERKAIYKRIFRTWHGKFNIYGAFIEHSVNLLKPGGKLVFVVPASWLVLDDFAKLRVFLANSGCLSVYYVGKVFPRRNVSCVVMVLEKGGKGMSLYDGRSLVVSKPNYKGELIRFETPQALSFEQSGIHLERLFEIHFAARSPEIRSHPQVSTKPQSGLVPVLTGRNLKTGWIDYEHCYSGFWMPKEAAPTLRFFYGFPHIVVGHTKGTKVVTAVDERCYPWREEFHLIPKVHGLDLHAIVRYLNSKPVQEYVRCLYRDFVPHLTLTMLKRVPIPQDLTANSKMPILPLEVERGD
ncbi:MAG: Eco57I restriction-modification methylase domain-containing protein [Armatimonadetes bacterium]|nr:Eco57I restriction-modification methylase domain-containing protein [Armatimonadota bacterium]